LNTHFLRGSEGVKYMDVFHNSAHLHQIIKPPLRWFFYLWILVDENHRTGFTKIVWNDFERASYARPQRGESQG